MRGQFKDDPVDGQQKLHLRKHSYSGLMATVSGRVTWEYFIHTLIKIYVVKERKPEETNDTRASVEATVTVDGKDNPEGRQEIPY